MTPKQRKAIEKFVADNIGAFHGARLKKLQKIKLDAVLRRCNPYLMRAKRLEVAGDFVKTLCDVYLTHGEQTIFGNFLEEIALFVVKKLRKGRKSGIEGMDLEFVHGGAHYIVSIKSGPNWGNSSGIKKQAELFSRAGKTIRQSSSASHVRAVLGCCFGRDNNPDKGGYHKFCGQDFWKFISGDDRLYLDIIKPLGYEAKLRNDEFNKAYAQVLNIAVGDFTREYCNGGIIDWEKLVKLNSERREPKRRVKAAKKQQGKAAKKRRVKAAK